MTNALGSVAASSSSLLLPVLTSQLELRIWQVEMATQHQRQAFPRQRQQPITTAFTTLTKTAGITSFHGN
jgi:hypothetical protein